MATRLGSSDAVGVHLPSRGVAPAASACSVLFLVKMPLPSRGVSASGRCACSAPN